jgi:hypothetical protein
MITSRVMRWAGYVACMHVWDRREVLVGWGSLKEMGHLECLGTYRRIILK